MATVVVLLLWRDWPLLAERLLLTHGAEGEVGSCCSRVNYRYRCCSRTGMEEWQM